MKTPEDLMSREKITFELGAKYKIENRYEALGGCAANVASGLSRLGLEVGCYSKIGDDLAGGWIKEVLENNGVSTELVKVENDFSSDLSAIVVDEKSGDRIIFSNQKVNGTLSIIPEEIKHAEWFFLGDLQGDWEKHLNEIFEVARENNIRIANNPRQSNIHDNPQKVLEFISKSEIVFLNKDESIEILSAKGGYSPEKLDEEKILIENVLAMGPKIVSITDGTRGAWAYDGKKIVYASSQKVEARDATGAGDAYSSGFLAAHIKGKSLEECLQWGIANSSGSVQFYGGIEGLLGESKMVEVISGIEVEEIA